MARILANSNNTTVNLNDSTAVTLQAGDVHEFVYTSPTIIESNKTVSVGIFTITANNGCSNSKNGDPSVIMINPNEQMLLDSITFFTVDDYAIAESFIHVVTRTSDTSTITLNGTPVTNFSILSADSSYAFSSFKVPAGSYQLITEGCGFLAYAIGLGSAESYAYAAGVSLVDLDCEPSFEPVSLTCKELTAGADIRFTACHNRSNFTYSWQFGDSTSASGAAVVKSFKQPGDYPIRLITQSPCIADTSTRIITIKPSISSLDLFPDTIICNNPNGIELSTFHPQFASWLWEDSSTNARRTVYSPGTYIVFITDTSGCSFTDTIQVDPTPNPSVHLDSAYRLCPNDPLILEAPEGYTYRWQGTVTDSTRQIWIQTTGTYLIHIEDSLGCYDEDSTIVYSELSGADLFIPNVFTPGNDHTNDLFFIPISNFSSTYFRIYNRWGEQVYQVGPNEDVAWDGTVDGYHLPPGTYFWMAEIGSKCKDYQKLSGTVTLIR
ncbi:MAG: gliding motility-associated C-terminal domain-containing protein [Flavobacteriales bacterium]|nr:gliding motility-associated C-terminal domain-containing protein [Flavobacteriales bacterium]